MFRLCQGLLVLTLVGMGQTMAQEISSMRREDLVRMVRQDCGSCHGMRLTGGLGPPLTPAALADKPLSAMAAVIYHGRAGTPMPAWRSMLTTDESQWIAAQLLAGFPEEAGRP